MPGLASASSASSTSARNEGAMTSTTAISCGCGSSDRSCAPSCFDSTPACNDTTPPRPIPQARFKVVVTLLMASKNRCCRCHLKAWSIHDPFCPSTSRTSQGRKSPTKCTAKPAAADSVLQCQDATRSDLFLYFCFSHINCCESHYQAH